MHADELLLQRRAPLTNYHKISRCTWKSAPRTANKRVISDSVRGAPSSKTRDSNAATVGEGAGPSQPCIRPSVPITTCSPSDSKSDACQTASLSDIQSVGQPTCQAADLSDSRSVRQTPCRTANLPDGKPVRQQKCQAENCRLSDAYIE